MINTLKCNQKIAEFIGYIKDEPDSKIYIKPSGDFINEDQLDFHDNFNSMMEVVEFIHNLPETYIFSIMGNVVKFIQITPDLRIMRDFVTSVKPTIKESVFEAIELFINEYKS